MQLKARSKNCSSLAHCLIITIKICHCFFLSVYNVHTGLKTKLSLVEATDITNVQENTYQKCQ